jgi:light-regulated signal transduction histidine kinase (bacteriophytochrome)
MRARAKQIIDNLLSNAVKYTSDGSRITVEVDLAEETGFLQVSVADNGVGISLKSRIKYLAAFFGLTTQLSPAQRAPASACILPDLWLSYMGAGSGSRVNLITAALSL